MVQPQRMGGNEVTERRLKNEEEKAKDQKAVHEAVTRVLLAVESFYEHWGYCDGDYGEIGQRHYDSLKNARDMFRGPQGRERETHVAEDWTDMSKEDVRTTTSSHWYEKNE